MLCVGAVLYLAWYAEDRARTKLSELGSRAGLAIEVGAIVLEPRHFVEIRDMVVTDPDDAVVLARISRVATDLTLGEARDGKRIPGRVALHGLELDFTDLGRWKRALARWRGADKPKPEGTTKATLPVLEFSGATFHVPDPVGGSPLTLSDVSARLAPPGASVEGADATRFRLALSGVLEGKHRLSVDVLLDLQGGKHEGGLTFDPPLAMAQGPGGPTATLEGVFVAAGDRVRARGLRLSLGPEDTVSVGTVELAFPEGTSGSLRADLLALPLKLELRDVLAQVQGASASAGRVHVDLAAGRLNQLPQRVRRVAVEKGAVDGGDLLVAATLGSLELSLDGFDASAPLHQLSALTANGLDLAGALPDRQRVAGSRVVARLRELMRLPTTAGGGPAEAEPPQPLSADKAAQKAHALLGRLFGDRPPPPITLEDATVALLAGEPLAPVAIVQRFTATLRHEGGVVIGKVDGQLHELATAEDGTFGVEVRMGAGGQLESAHLKLAGSKLAHQLTRVWESFRVTESTRVALDLTLKPERGEDVEGPPAAVPTHALAGRFTVSGKAAVSNLGFFAPRIHGTEVTGIEVDSELVATWDGQADQLVLEVPRVEVGGDLTLRLSATVDRVLATFAPRLLGLETGRKLKFSAKLDVPRQDCGGLISAIPPSMVPRLEGLVLSGTAEGHVHTSVDLEAPRTYEQDIDFDMQSCRPVEWGEADVRKLNGEFVQEVVEKGVPIGVTVGPGTWHYRSLDRIPKFVQLGALWTEDHSFYQHKGFRPPLIRRAVIMNLEGGRYVYGGSTITQQLVKNLFLSREKTLTRKLEEAVFVWLMERTLTKDRILELYLNCIEYGPSIYGIENAARAYFGRHVEEVDALDAAFLMGLKPYPWAGWDQLERGYVKPWWHKRLSKIVNGMARQGWITEEQRAAAEATGWEPQFITSPQRPRREPAADDGALPTMPGDADDDPVPGPAPL